MMMRVKTTSRGQVVIPKRVREALNIRAGSELTVESSADAVTFRLPPKTRRRGIDELIGCLPHAGRAKTLQEMEQGIDAAMQERWERLSR